MDQPALGRQSLEMRHWDDPRTWRVQDEKPKTCLPFRAAAGWLRGNDRRQILCIAVLCPVALNCVRIAKGLVRGGSPGPAKNVLGDFSRLPATNGHCEQACALIYVLLGNPGAAQPPFRHVSNSYNLGQCRVQQNRVQDWFVRFITPLKIPRFAFNLGLCAARKYLARRPTPAKTAICKNSGLIGFGFHFQRAVRSFGPAALSAKSSVLRTLAKALS